MTTIHKLPNGFTVEVARLNAVPYLFREGMHVVCNPIVLQEIVKMRELLQAVSDQYCETGVDDIVRDKPIISILKYVESFQCKQS